MSKALVNDGHQSCLLFIVVALPTIVQCLTYNNLAPALPTQPFQPAVSKVGCSSAKFSTNDRQTFFLLHGSCFAGAESTATWLYSVGPNTWLHSDPTFWINGKELRPRVWHASATLLSGYGVITFGGALPNLVDNATVPLDDVWIYLADTFSWQEVARLPAQMWPEPRWWHSMVAYTTRETQGIFLFGGATVHPSSSTNQLKLSMLNDLWLVSANTNEMTVKWTQIVTKPDNTHGSPRSRGGQAMAVGGDSIWIFGGATGPSMTNLTFLLDLWQLNRISDMYTWAAKPSLPTDKERCYSAGMNYVKTDAYEVLIVLLACLGEEEMSVWSYSIDRDSWEPVWYVSGDSLPPSFVRPISLEHAGQVYIYGGIDSHSRAFSGLWVLRFDPKESTCVQAAAPEILPPLVSQHAAAFNKYTHSMYVTGGVYSIQPVFSGFETDNMELALFHIYVYNVTGQAWTSMHRSNSPSPRGCHSLNSIGRSLFVFGGYNHTGMSQSDMSRFDLGTLRWKDFDVDPLPPPRQAHSTFAVEGTGENEGMIYMFGGLDVTGNSPRALADLWVCHVSNVNGSCMELHPVNDTKPPVMFGHTLAKMGDYLYALGGASIATKGSVSTITAVPKAVWRYHLVESFWENVSDELPQQHPLQLGRYFHSSAIQDNSVFTVTAGDCLSPCVIKHSSIYSGQVLSAHTVSYHCCAMAGQQSDVEVWQLHKTQNRWMEVVMSVQHPSQDVLQVGQTSVIVDDHVLLHGGLCTSASSDQCSNAYPTYSFTPGCNRGYSSPDVLKQACTACAVNGYSQEPGARDCTPCPMDTYSTTNASTNLLQCINCPRWMCNDAGTCTVDPITSQSHCNCDFGYDDNDRCKTPVLIISASVAAFIVLILVVLAALLVRKYRVKRQQEAEKERQLRTCHHEISQLNSLWCIDADELCVKERIDKNSPGTFGEVYLAIYRDMEVAVKKLQLTLAQTDGQASLEFQREAEFMRSIRHPNIVLFLGAGMFPSDGTPFLVVEYMAQGSLESALADHTQHIDHQRRLRIALDVAKGMRFLHNLNPPRIHRDLKSPNLLISKHSVVKVADFGSARWIESLERSQGTSSSSFNSSQCQVLIKQKPSHSVQSSHFVKETTPLLQADALMSTEVGTPAWSAPEVLASSSYGAPADVFSYAVVLWEIFTRKEPYADTNLRFGHEILEAVIAGERLAVPTQCPAAYRDLIYQCWDADPEKRPQFNDIVPRLDWQTEQCFVTS